MSIRTIVLPILLTTSPLIGCKEFCWEKVEFAFNSNFETLEAITGCGDGTICAVGDGVIRKTRKWSYLKLNTGWGIADVWCSSQQDVFVANYGRISHYDGNEWTTQADNLDWHLRTLWGSAPDNVFAAGEYNERDIILHYDGIDWTEMYNGTTEGRILSIWGSGSEDVFAVGYEGECKLWQLSGSEWVRVTDYTYGCCGDIWGSSKEDIYIAGGDGIIHYDGIGWTKVEIGNEWSYSRLCGTASDDVYALQSRMEGPEKSVLYYNGKRWRDISDESLDGRGLNDIWATPEGEIYIAAVLWARYYSYGAILEYTCR